MMTMASLTAHPPPSGHQPTPSTTSKPSHLAGIDCNKIWCLLHQQHKLFNFLGSTRNSYQEFSTRIIQCHHWSPWQYRWQPTHYENDAALNCFGRDCSLTTISVGACCNHCSDRTNETWWQNLQKRTERPTHPTLDTQSAVTATSTAITQMENTRLTVPPPANLQIPDTTPMTTSNMANLLLDDEYNYCTDLKAISAACKRLEQKWLMVEPHFPKSQPTDMNIQLANLCLPVTAITPTCAMADMLLDNNDATHPHDMQHLSSLMATFKMQVQMMCQINTLLVELNNTVENILNATTCPKNKPTPLLSIWLAPHDNSVHNLPHNLLSAAAPWTPSANPDSTMASAPCWSLPQTSLWFKILPLQKVYTLPNPPSTAAVIATWWQPGPKTACMHPRIKCAHPQLDFSCASINQHWCGSSLSSLGLAW